MAVKQRCCVGLGVAVTILVLVLIGLADRSQVPEVEIALATYQSLEESMMTNSEVEPVQPCVVRAEFATFVEEFPLRRSGCAPRSGDSNARCE